MSCESDTSDHKKQCNTSTEGENPYLTRKQPLTYIEKALVPREVAETSQTENASDLYSTYQQSCSNIEGQRSDVTLLNQSYKDQTLIKQFQQNHTEQERIVLWQQQHNLMQKNFGVSSAHERPGTEETPIYYSHQPLIQINPQLQYLSQAHAMVHGYNQPPYEEQVLQSQLGQTFCQLFMPPLTPTQQFGCPSLQLFGEHSNEQYMPQDYYMQLLPPFGQPTTQQFVPPFGQPLQQQFKQPSQRQFGQLPQQQFGLPTTQQFVPPFGQPAQQQFGQHTTQQFVPPFGQPAQQQFEQPPQQQFEQPPQKQFEQPPQQQFEQLTQQQFGQLQSQQGTKNETGETTPNEPIENTRPGTNSFKLNPTLTPRRERNLTQNECGDDKKERTDPKKDEVDTGDEGTSQRTKRTEKMYVCVHGIESDVSNDNVFNYLENRSKVEVIVKESLRTLRDPIHAVIVFMDRVDLESLKQACNSKRLKTSKMTFNEIDPPRNVIVSSEDDSLTETKLKDYLQKNDIQIARTRPTDEGTISIKIKNFEAMEQIMESTNINIDGCKIVMSALYNCNHGTYWNHSLHRVTIPDPYKPTHIDEHVKGFLADIISKCNEHLEPHHAYLSVSDEIHIKCTLDPKDKSARRKVKVWKDNVEKAMQEFINENAQKRKLKVTNDTKDLLKEHINKTKEEHKPEDLKVIYEDSGITIIFVGKSNIMETFYERVSAKKAEIQSKWNRRNKMKTISMTLKVSEIAFMSKHNKLEMLSHIASDLTYQVDDDNGTITLSGVKEDIEEAKHKINETRKNFYTWNVTNMSLCQCRLLSNQTVSDTVYENLQDNNISAIFRIDKKKIEICSTSKKSCQQVEKILKEIILEENIKLDKSSIHVLKLDDWEQKKTRIKNDFPHVVHIEDSDGNKIVVTALSNLITQIVDELKELIQEHSVYPFNIEVGNKAEIKLLEMHCKDVVKDLIYRHKNLSIQFHKESVKGEGTEMATMKTRDEIYSKLSMIKKDLHTVTKPGVDTLFDDQTKYAPLINPIEEESQTVILVDEIAFTKTSHHRNAAYKKINKDHAWNHAGSNLKRDDNKPRKGHAMKSGPVRYTNGTRIIIVKKEDLGKQQADVIVCSTNAELNLSSPAGKSLVSVAGQQILDEIKTKYKDGIKHGDIAIVSGHNLKCQEVYLASLPGWSPGGDKILSKSVNDCLTRASQSQHGTIVFPALGTGHLNYPRDLVAETMYRCVQDFDKNNTTLKEVKFLCYDYETIKTFEKKEAVILNPDVHPPVAAATYTSSQYKTHNITVTVVTGDIGKQKVDSMVSAVPSNLKLEGAGGAGKSLLQELGPGVQMDINTQHPNGVTSGDLAAVKLSTPAGSCKAVYLTSLDTWEKEKHIPHDSDKQIYKFVYKCLETAQKDGYTSIAIPAMGTGKIGYPHDLVAKYLFDVVEKFADSNKNSKVTDVKFVVHHTDTKSIQSFVDEEKKRMSKPVHTVVPQTGLHGFATEGANTCTAVSFKTLSDKGFQVGKIIFSVEHGNILYKKCDAIVNGSNDDLDFTKGAVSKAIRSKCDVKKLDAECKKKKKEMKQNHIVRTSACGLPSTKHIIHVNSVNNLKDWRNIIIKALCKAEKKKLTSLAFPALGTGISGVNQEEMGRTIMESLIDFVGDGKTTHLKNVYLVIFKQDMVQPMLKGVRSCGQPPTSPTDVQKQVIKSKNKRVKSVTFVIYSMSSQESDEAKKQLDKAVSDKYATEHIHDQLISELIRNEIECLQSVEDKYPITMDIDQFRSEVIIEGTTDHILNAKQHIYECLRNFSQIRHTEEAAEIIKNKVQWYFKERETQTGSTKLRPYPPMINMYLENAHKGNSNTPKVDFIDEKGEKFIIDIKTMTKYATKNPSDSVEVIRREQTKVIDSFELPSTWGEQGTDDVRVFPLSNTDIEYKCVEHKFIDSVKNGQYAKHQDVKGKTVVVSKIERIQNLNLFRMYAAKRALMEKQNGNVKNEKELWHGTPESAVVSINLYGFNRSYCTANSQDAWWGQGVYFATDASYSVRDFLTRPGQSSVSQERNIYLCLVLTGVSRKGTKHEPLRVLPIRKDGTMLPYDSNTDDLNPPLEYVVFNDTQAYPLYRIKFQLK